MRRHFLRHATLISLLAILLGAPLAGSLADDSDADPEAEMQRIQAMMDEGDWKGADKALKIYGRKFAKTDEEKAEVERLRSRAKGEMELADIRKNYLKKEHHRKTANQLFEFLDDFGEHDELCERAGELLTAARSAYVHVIEDFEGGGDDDAPEGIDDSPRGKSIVTDAKRVKQGLRAGRWKTGRGWDSWAFDLTEMDWSGYDFLCFWAFNEKVGNPMAHFEIEAYTGGYHYYQAWIAVDWVGWKEFRLPLRGRASKFGKHGNPEWSSIERLWFDKDEDHVATFDIILDDVRLEKLSK